MRKWITLAERFGTTEKLYHGTNIDSMWLILRDGKMKAGHSGRDYPGPTGICLSRSFSVAYGFADVWVEFLGDSFYDYFDLGDAPDNDHVVFEFDRARIKEKLIAYDDFGPGEGHDGSEEEERVIGDLSLDSLVGIYVDPKAIRDFLEAAVKAHKNGGKEYDDQFRSIITNVLNDPRLRNIRDHGY